MQAAWKQWDAENREPLWQEAPSLPSHQAKVEVFPTEIRVQCTGNDPQLILSEIPAGTGPFTLELKVKSTSAGPGELFWATTDAPQFVPGQSVQFQLQHDGQAWREYTVELPATAQPLRHLRFDPGNAPGLVRIARLVLKDAKGKLLKTWIGDAERTQPAAKVGASVR